MKIVLILSSLIFTQTHCPDNRIFISTPCYGECGNFIDDNSNGICDIWEKYNNERKTKQTTVLKQPQSWEEQKQSIQTQTKLYKVENTKKSSLLQKLFSNGVFYILLITSLASIISEIFFTTSHTLRIIWNWVLLLSTLLSALSGYILYFGFFEESKKLWYLLHIQSSTVFFITSIYHILKRFKCMI